MKKLNNKYKLFLKLVKHINSCLHEVQRTGCKIIKLIQIKEKELN